MSFVALLALSLGPAHALDCASVHVGSTLPADGAVDVPVNARPMVAATGQGERLEFVLEADGVPVDDAVFALVAEGDPAIYQLQSPAQLAPDTAHVLRAVEADSVEGSGEPWTVAEVSFQTGSAEDLEAPASVSEVVPYYTETEDEWGGERLFGLELEGGADPSGTAWILEFDTDPGFSDPTVRMRLTNPAEVSSGWCTFDSVAEWDPAATHVRITPVDLAGNAGEPVEASFAGAGDGDEHGEFICGTRCSVVPAPVFGLGGLLLGALGLVRRRER